MRNRNQPANPGLCWAVSGIRGGSQDLASSAGNTGRKQAILAPKTTRNTATRKTTRSALGPSRKQHAVARAVATGRRQARMGRELAAASGKTIAYRAALI